MIYLDNSATTALSAGAVYKMNEAMGCFGNPSSLHSAGYQASLLLDAARRSISASLGCRATGGYSLIFTGSGTEANNLAISGCAAAKVRRQTNRIITTNSEHPSVAEPLAALEGEGFDIVRLSTRRGIIDIDEYSTALAAGAFMVSIMMVNNETGAQYDIETLFALAKETCPRVITHCDATQGYLKKQINLPRMNIDLLTVSAHKVHGPKGVGALCVSPQVIKARALSPVIRGGGQENGFRSGTENMVGIAGFWGTVEEYHPQLAENTTRLLRLRNYAEERLSALEGIRLNIPAGMRAPHIINLTLPGIKSETMVHYLSSRGIAVSSGSACSSRREDVSDALLGFGLEKREAVCSIRISLCESNTTDEIDSFTEALSFGLGELIRIK